MTEQAGAADTTNGVSQPDDSMMASAFELLSDLSNPQPKYVAMIRNAPCVTPLDGLLMSYGRESTDAILRSADLFSSSTPLGLGNVRPLIPLNVDPPEHAKYRKILDPLFAPKAMDRQESDIAMRVNRFIGVFRDRGECNFTEEFADQFPSSVFLGLMGLPSSELDTMLRLRDGILHPEKIDPAASVDLDVRAGVNAATGREIYRYFESWLNERARDPREDILTHFLNAEIDGDRLSREEILDICFLFLIAGLDTVSDSLTLFWAFLARNPAHRRQIVDDPSIIPTAVEELLRWESPVPVGVPRLATTDTTLPGGIRVDAGTACMVSYGPPTWTPPSLAIPRRFASIGRRTGTSPSAEACTAAWVRISLAGSCASPSASGTE